MLPARTKQRHELKFELPPHEALLLAKRLGMLFPRDEHAGPDGRYTVRSLYFDTPFDDALREKHEGFTSRAKWRMRAYGTEPLATDGAERVIRLEKKVKRNGAGSKHASWLTPREARSLAIPSQGTPREQKGQHEHRLSPAPDREASNDPVLEEFKAGQRVLGLRPCVVVTYEREAFTFEPGNVRITLDARMRSCKHPESFFDPSRLLAPYAPGAVVLEVKYDAYLPDIVRDAIQVPGAVRVAHSKYALARRFE